jgi:hypothetical protein
VSILASTSFVSPPSQALSSTNSTFPSIIESSACTSVVRSRYRTHARARENDQEDDVQRKTRCRGLRSLADSCSAGFHGKPILSSRLSSVCEVQSEGYGRDRRTATAVNRRCSSLQAALATATGTGPTRRRTGGPPVSGIWVGEGERHRRARLSLRDCRAGRGATRAQGVVVVVQQEQPPVSE